MSRRLLVLLLLAIGTALGGCAQGAAERGISGSASIGVESAALRGLRPRLWPTLP